MTKSTGVRVLNCSCLVAAVQSLRLRVNIYEATFMQHFSYLHSYDTLTPFS